MLRHFTAADGVVLAAEEAGNPQGPCVLLLHGGGQTRQSWHSTMAVLATAGYRALAYDSRGHGDSDWTPDGHYSFPLRAADLRAVVAELRVPVTLVGASMGGVTAMEALSAGLPDVAALVLVDIVMNPDRAGVQRVRDFMAANPQGFATLEDAVDAVAAYNPHRPRPRDPRHLLRNLRLRDDGRLHWHWDPRMVPDTLDNDMRELERVATDFKPPATLPLLLVRGANSDVVTARNELEFHAALPQAEVQVVSGAGHMVAGDSQRMFNTAILDFLSRHVPTGRVAPDPRPRSFP